MTEAVVEANDPAEATKPVETTKPRGRTWSRELAVVMIVGCVYLAALGQTEELDIVIWPTTVFTLAAFGFRQPAVGDWMRGS